MNKDWQPTPLGDLLKRSEKLVNINPFETYKQVTVRLWGQGVILRDEVSDRRYRQQKDLKLNLASLSSPKLTPVMGPLGCAS